MTNDDITRNIETAATLSVDIARELNALLPATDTGWQAVYDIENGFARGAVLHRIGAPSSDKLSPAIYLDMAGGYGKKPGTVEINGRAPFHAVTGMVFPSKYTDGTEAFPKITVAISRGAKTIAKEILRRFLPEYLRLFGICKGRIESTIAYQSGARENARHLAALLGMETELARAIGPRNERETSVKFGPYGCSVETHSEGGTLTFRGTIDELAEVAQAIAAVRARRPAGEE